MKNILEVARIIRVMEDDSITKDEKILVLKNARDDGYITTDEGVELILEYFG